MVIPQYGILSNYAQRANYNPGGITHFTYVLMKLSWHRLYSFGRVIIKAGAAGSSAGL
jgi:hypothetical protein